MTHADIRNHRLLNQHIACPSCKTPQDVVSSLVAMQAQEFAFAKWAIGLRMPEATESLISEAFNNGDILRTHLMRPTWHFVAPKDIRWLLALTGLRVMQVNGFIYRQEGLEAKTFNRCNDIIAHALEGGKHLKRTELQAILAQNKIRVSGVALTSVMMQAELDGIICSGPREGKQFTYALLDERVPAVKAIGREEALTSFIARYFASRGPATVKDFTTWSGLTVKDAREGITNLPPSFVCETIDGDEYYFIPRDTKPAEKGQRTFLMPPYDEYGMAYKDRSAFLPASGERTKESQVYSHIIVVDGIGIGSWKPVTKGKTTTVEYAVPATLCKKHIKEVEAAAAKYEAFVNEKT